MERTTFVPTPSFCKQRTFFLNNRKKNYRILIFIPTQYYPILESWKFLHYREPPSLKLNFFSNFSEFSLKFNKSVERPWIDQQPPDFAFSRKECSNVCPPTFYDLVLRVDRWRSTRWKREINNKPTSWNVGKGIDGWDRRGNATPLVTNDGVATFYCADLRPWNKPREEIWMINKHCYRTNGDFEKN